MKINYIDVYYAIVRVVTALSTNNYFCFMRFEFMMGVADLRHPYSSARLTDARAQIIDALGLLLTPATKSIYLLTCSYYLPVHFCQF